jgi:hypothetical protein
MDPALVAALVSLPFPFPVQELYSGSDRDVNRRLMVAEKSFEALD